MLYWLLVAPHPSYEPKEVKEAGRQELYHYKGVLNSRRDYKSVDGSKPLFDSVVVMEGERATLHCVLLVTVVKRLELTLFPIREQLEGSSFTFHYND